MRYVALAADYDGTLATESVAGERIVAALEKLSASGRKLILVTGRELDDLLSVFPQINLFDRVVAENGALMYVPATRERKPLADPLPMIFIDELRRRGVTPLSVGGAIAATLQPNEVIVLQVIRDLGLELQVIFNKGAVMVLPASVNKASGLKAALKDLGLSSHNTVATGDGENDHAMLEYAEYSMAVGNAVPMLKERADRVAEHPNGHGVAQLIEDMMDNDLRAQPPRTMRHKVVLGSDAEGVDVVIPPAGIAMLIAGTSGSGKSTLATGMLERLGDDRYQFCIIDPEGDHQQFPGAVSFGDQRGGPNIAEIMDALRKPDVNVVVNLVGLPLQDRPAFFMSLLPQIRELRATMGRPHWLLIDEAHHMLPAGFEPENLAVADGGCGTLYVTVHPEAMSRPVLQNVNVIATLGDDAAAALATFCDAAAVKMPSISNTVLQPGHAFLWQRGASEQVSVLTVMASRAEHHRHRRKYAEGELPPERSFFFRGPQGKLNLRAQNLIIFNQIAEGVDDETWLHHLRAGDYSKWMRECIKDKKLADEIAEAEHHSDVPAGASRLRVRKVIESHYTLPAEATVST